MGNEPKAGHLRVTDPSAWVTRFAPLIREGGPVLDLACGGGRHARHLLELGHPVTAIDRDAAYVADLEVRGGAEVLEHDLEDGAPWPFEAHRFAGVVVVNYLHRPLFGDLLACLEPDGVLIYETFARGNEAYSRPRNPDHLLEAGELLRLAAGGDLRVVAYEHGIVDKGTCPGVVERICAVAGGPWPRALEPSGVLRP